MKAIDARSVRTLASILTLALLAAAMSGCGTGTQKSGTATAAIYTGPADTVTALGTGKASAAPDRADITFNAYGKANTTKGAMDAAGKIASAVVAAMKAAGVPEQDIQTQNVNLNPRRDRNNVITGYEATISTRVTTKDISKAGDLLDVGVKAGANDVWGPALSLSETNAARADAIDAAVADARTRAERMAKAAGRTVGGVVSITEQGAISPYPLYAARGAGVSYGAASMDIQPGQSDSYANVSVTFELK